MDSGYWLSAGATNLLGEKGAQPPAAFEPNEGDREFTGSPHLEAHL
jgi:hypothetical protein